MVQEAESAGSFEEELRESGALRCVGVDDSDVGTEKSQTGESATEELSAFRGEDVLVFLFQKSSEPSAESSD